MCSTAEAGAEHYLTSGVALPDDVLRAAATADAILLGAMGTRTSATPTAPRSCRRSTSAITSSSMPAFVPIRAIAGVRQTLAGPRARDIDLVIVRESTEGLFAARARAVREGDAAVLDTMRITRRDPSGCSMPVSRWRAGAAGTVGRRK